MRQYSASELAVILRVEITANFTFERISTDTRSIQAGDLFVALVGDNFDGHQFIRKAIEIGAVACIVSQPIADLAIPQVVVTDTKLALADMAKNIRHEFLGKVVGLTGSVGKTSNKQMLKSVLSIVGQTHATKGNLNNELGVPFTFFDLPLQADFAVIEMGASRQGDIDYLTQITQPDVAMITNAGTAHLEGFGGVDGVAKGKGEIFGYLSPDGVAVINFDDNYCNYWRSLLDSKQRCLLFSYKNSQADIYAGEVNQDFSAFTLHCQGQSCAVNLPVSGQHHIINALGVAACAIALGLSLAQIALGLSHFEGEKGRMQVIAMGKATLIDDSYNANPTSVLASMQALSAYDGKRILVLGDMAELGQDERALHQQLAKNIGGFADVFYCFGELMQTFAEEIGDKARHFQTLAVLNQALLADIRHHQAVTVLVKGSRSMQMERVVAYLQTELGN